MTEKKRKPSAMKILVIHGPNLNLLGEREIDIYGRITIKEINSTLQRVAKAHAAELKIVQSNHEGDIVDLIGKAKKSFQGILINPAAYTHTSVAIRDALSAATIPAVEAHISNIYKREEFRQHSLTAAACVGQVAGFGMDSYVLGLQGLIHSIATRKRAGEKEN
ncbi:MAG: type II 3-dehydroquinate dehydratase [Candidatus Omnitrophica bacterium]|nr:type II 3-dehydroquinate dehydratase [Candidatus Omnitrophota bacterium]MDD5671294.1 type II 3-dehydroquinate dehydratase [Candidatus Omnitrophota bacterium]